MDFSLEAEQRRQFDNYVLHRSNRTMESLFPSKKEEPRQRKPQFRAIIENLPPDLSKLSTGVLNDSQFVILYCKSCPKDFFQVYEKQDGTSIVSAIVIEEEGKQNIIFYLPGSKFFIEKKAADDLVEREKHHINNLDWDRIFLDSNGKKKPMKINFGYGPEKKLHVGENYSKYFPSLWSDTTWDKIYCHSYSAPAKGPKLP